MGNIDILACNYRAVQYINTTRYRDTKQYQSTSSFGIIGIDYATCNQTGEDFGSHFQLIWIKLVG